ncbi:hypothetical protein GCM10009789_04580 [Kribbella sancticallisti]|uniref:Uncharacterized protein n=1 Tax=Kribbella sancticallisti TaxID=460087 RepID=A0ABN2C837_9ACTN
MFDDADALHTGDIRNRRRTEVRRTGGAQQIERYYRRGGDPDDAPALARYGIGVFGGRRRFTVNAQYGGSHAGLLAGQVATSG